MFIAQGSMAHAAETSPALSAQQIIERLAPPPALSAAPAPGEPPAAIAADPASAAAGVAPSRRLRNLQPVERRIDLSIPFQFDAAVMRPEGQVVLNELAVAMQSERLRGTRFRLEGHTDAKGSAEYNERLSEQRARTVASYLVRQGVDPQRLQAVGKGFREPLPGEDPLSPENRRVRIVAVGAD